MRSEEERMIVLVEKYHQNYKAHKGHNETLDTKLQSFTDPVELRFLSRMASINENGNNFALGKLVTLSIGGIVSVVTVMNRIKSPTRALVITIAVSIMFYAFVSMWASHAATRNHLIVEAIKRRLEQLGERDSSGLDDVPEDNGESEPIEAKEDEDSQSVHKEPSAQ